MKLSELEWSEPRDDKIGSFDAKQIYAKRFKSPNRHTYLGIDPGRNFGIALVMENSLEVWYGSFSKREPKWQYGIDAFYLGENLCAGDAVIEGAAYGKQFGQPDLAYIRFGFLLGIRENGVLCRLVPPAVPRKVVLGRGDKSGPDIWPLMNKNAADAVILALYAAGWKEE